MVGSANRFHAISQAKPDIHKRAKSETVDGDLELSGREDMLVSMGLCHQVIHSFATIFGTLHEERLSHTRVLAGTFGNKLAEFVEQSFEFAGLLCRASFSAKQTLHKHMTAMNWAARNATTLV